MPQTFVQDLRVAGRLLRKSPVFTLTAALSLAIGLGSTTAIFSLVDALLFKSRPGVADPSTLVDVGRTGHGRGGFDTSSYPNYVDLRDRTTVIHLAAYRVEPVAMSFRDNGEPERIYVTMATGSYFGVLGTRAAAGRLFRADEDDRAARQPTIVLSDALWDRMYHRDPGAIGRSVVLNGVETTIVGVAERGFRGTNFMAPDAWVPVGMFPVLNPGSNAMLTTRKVVWLLLIGRLNPGVSIGRAQAEIATIARQLEQSYPDSNREMSWRVAPSSFLPGFFQAPVTAFLALLMAIVSLVLLIACVNLAGVLMARGTARRRELAVRVAIGAGRARIVRQLITETLVVFAIGCALGLLVAAWIVDALSAIPAALPVPVLVDVTLDGRVLLFAIVLTLVSGTLSALVPALPLSRADLVSSLKDDGGPALVRRMRARGVLLVAQVALSCLLLVVAALVARSLQRAGQVNPGFDARNVDIISFDFSMGGYRG
ncbi:MAG TPA: ABC transporter permease, partial [Gemmatimonadaceae bacterium]|nr:ABC transporter permease [Gemmatimonadaceae bacterium]